MLKEYLNNIQDSINQGDAREESYYTHLDSLIRNFANENKIKKVDITILPKKTEAGNPDFRVWDLLGMVVLLVLWGFWSEK